MLIWAFVVLWWHIPQCACDTQPSQCLVWVCSNLILETLYLWEHDIARAKPTTINLTLATQYLSSWHTQPAYLCQGNSKNTQQHGGKSSRSVCTSACCIQNMHEGMLVNPLLLYHFCRMQSMSLMYDLPFPSLGWATKCRVQWTPCMPCLSA